MKEYEEAEAVHSNEQRCLLDRMNGALKSAFIHNAQE